MLNSNSSLPPWSEQTPPKWVQDMQYSHKFHGISVLFLPKMTKSNWTVFIRVIYIKHSYWGLSMLRMLLISLDPPPSICYIRGDCHPLPPTPELLQKDVCGGGSRGGDWGWHWTALPSERSGDRSWGHLRGSRGHWRKLSQSFLRGCEEVKGSEGRRDICQPRSPLLVTRSGGS